MKISEPDKFFEDGFPLDTPKVVLKWNAALEPLAKMSGGQWHSDRFLWHHVTYLDGLTYPLSSGNGVSAQSPLQEIWACIGLTEKGWSDDAALSGHQNVSSHLIKLFGIPHETTENVEVPSVKDLAWRFTKAHVTLSMIEQHVYKCHLRVRLAK